jgi:hypothetical protein
MRLFRQSRLGCESKLGSALVEWEAREGREVTAERSCIAR